MKNISFLTAILVIIMGVTGCKKEDPEPVLIPRAINLTARAGEVIDNSNDFGIDLFTLTAKETSGNMMLSPLSASVALTMLLNGSEGETFSQLREVLGYDEGMTIGEINEAYQGLVDQLLTVDPKVTLMLANALFCRNEFTIKPPFINTLETEFDAIVRNLDFDSPTAVTTINNWAKEHTNGKVTRVLSEIRPEMVLFLMNALYFKGDWTYQFDEQDSGLRPFFPEDGTTMQVEGMEGNIKIKRYAVNDFMAVELPYGRTNFSMIIIVPNGDLSAFYHEFNPALWKQITDEFKSMPEWMDAFVSMPKYEFEYEKILNDQLQSLEMIDAFSPSQADFRGISDQQIYVSFVKQNTFVKVNEKGTEAAAVTTIGMEYTSAGPAQVIVDKPFIFAIRETTTNTLLFIGSLMKP